ncbi:hypothetical protein D3C87_1684100 [compost metagenome]
MRLKQKHLPLNDLDRLKYTVSAVNEVVIHGNDHKRCFPDDSTQPSAVHGQIGFLEFMRFAGKSAKGFCRIKDW